MDHWNKLDKETKFTLIFCAVVLLYIVAQLLRVGIPFHSFLEG